MASFAKQPSEASTILMSLGPHFFSRVFKEEGDKGRVDDADATPREVYFIELSATGLGTDDILFVVPKVCTDLVAIGFLDLDTIKNFQPEKIGSATVSMTETRFQKSDDDFKSCIIEQLAVETGDSLTYMGAFVAILRRIQSLCIEKHAEHLAMAGTQSHRLSSALLKQAGFNLCECELLCKGVRAKFQLCMDLPTPPADTPASKDEASLRDGRFIREKDGVVVAAKDTQPAANFANIGDSLVRQKTHCNFWILTGECGFLQTGCRYKHEIPVTQSEFDRIGLRKVPAWFIRSQYWGPWYQRVSPGELEGLITGSRSMDLSTAQPSGQHSGQWANNASSHGGRNPTTATRDPARLEPYDEQHSHEDHYRNSIASNIGAEASRAGPSSATNIGNTKALNTTASRRPDREVYKPPGRARPSSSSENRGPAEESSEVRGTNVEKGRSKGRAKRRYRHKSPGPDTQ